jgi:hypothetical protein
MDGFLPSPPPAVPPPPGSATKGFTVSHVTVPPRQRLFPGPLRPFLLGLPLLLAAAGAEPCSICRCGDPTFNALGKDGYARPGWRLAFDWERFDKSEGPLDVEGEDLVENRFTLLAAYGFSDHLLVQARVPLSYRHFTEYEDGAVAESYDTSGLSDPDVSAQLRLWGSTLGPLGRRTSLWLQGGVKTALGQNDAMFDGALADEHAQPGTGSTDVTGGLSFVHLVDRRSSLFASTAYRRTGENSRGYRYGSVFLASLAYERKLGGRLDAVVELDYRDAARDTSDGEEQENTGGSLLYLTPRMLLDLGHGVVLRGALQIPVARSLNGVQEERVVANVGVTVLFGSP